MPIQERHLATTVEVVQLSLRTSEDAMGMDKSGPVHNSATPLVAALHQAREDDSNQMGRPPFHQAG